MTALPSANLLADAASPYLHQHAANPVHWRPWSSAALAEAAALQRPILLSVGYAACHWCHVMAHESFEDEGVAEVMNRLFVNIKVDREERPDIDQIYMAALNAMGEQGGWPLTMFLTPEGRPFWGGTYFPKEARYGRPGFTDVLEAVAATWRNKRAELEDSAAALTGHIDAQLASRRSGEAADPIIIQESYAGVVHSLIDARDGGIRGAPKFPNAPLMNVLRLSWQQGGVATHRDAMIDSLRKMLAGGIYDHIGGGLCRYSTDATWLVPHFEKMLYDNAQLIDLAGWAYAETGDELFRYRIEETMGWLEREMQTESGGFASSLDADSEGEEGRFYLWTEDEIGNVLGKADAGRFLEAYELAQPAEWEGDPVLHRRSNPDCGPADTGPDIQAMKRRLLDARGHRIRPGRDDKVLVDWNGTTIAVLARAGRQFSRKDWIETAESAFRFVTESERDGRLPHSILGAERLFPCMSADYAAMIEAAVSLAEAVADPAPYIARARRWMQALDDWHGDDEGTGHYFTASDAADVLIRIRGDSDDAVPSATARIILTMTRLALLTGDDALHRRAVNAADAALGRTADQRFGRAGIIHAAAIAHRPKKLIIAGPENTGFVSATNRYPDGSRTDIVLSPTGPGSDVVLPDGAVIDTAQAGAFLCIGQRCLPPARKAGELETLLRSER
ncbi:MAG: thioredoxin domain-containing protein [Aquamicrobium sp.]|uniref:thioredoxin domain-containing protein n=1 Tax=Aquamicrobium sp. TaxID=1872579 RepID=UPI00349E5211|nr:thioredoxin domain-containing protein [Aquamicrobium sp.]